MIKTLKRSSIVRSQEIVFIELTNDEHKGRAHLLIHISYRVSNSEMFFLDSY
jgi:hypothetical protein